MLSGEFGEPAAKAIEVLVRVGEALGAERLVEISHAHISGVSYFNVGDFGMEFIEDFSKAGARFSVFATANPYAVMEGYGSKNYDRETVGKQLRIVNALKRMGVNSFTCTPYYVRRPTPGEHLAWAESSAVLYANSVLGSMTNREPGPLALMSGVVGRTYLGEAHKGLPSEVGFVVKIERPEDPSEAGAYGLLAGEYLGSAIPEVHGLEGYPDSFLKEFLAAFATISPSHLAVLYGITPGYFKVDATKAERLTLTKSDISRLHSEIDSCSSPIYLIGCPHLSPEEIGDIVSKIEDVHRGELWVTTGEQLGTFYGIERGRKLKVLTGSCAVTTRLDLLGVDCVVTDSAKALVYIPKLARVRAFLVRRSEILKRVSRVD